MDEIARVKLQECGQGNGGQENANQGNLLPLGHIEHYLISEVSSIALEESGVPELISIAGRRPRSVPLWMTLSRALRWKP